MRMGTQTPLLHSMLGHPHFPTVWSTQGKFACGAARALERVYRQTSAVLMKEACFLRHVLHTTDAHHSYKTLSPNHF
jgi:hypothetical protein